MGGLFAFILLPATVGVIAIHASQTCERFVRNYVTKPVRNRVSKATNEAWAKWRIAHPNWKPNPKLHRPKYVMDRQETVDKVEFACTMPTDPSHLDMLFTPADFEAPPVIVNLPPMEGTPITFPDVVPPEVSELQPTDSWPPFAPYIPPILGSLPSSDVPTLPVTPPSPPPVTGEVPEPPSLLLTALGIAALASILRIKNRAATPST
jgi:hypothetical protein